MNCMGNSPYHHMFSPVSCLIQLIWVKLCQGSYINVFALNALKVNKSLLLQGNSAHKSSLLIFIRHIWGCLLVSVGGKKKSAFVIHVDHHILLKISQLTDFTHIKSPSSITDMLVHSCNTYVKMIRGWRGGRMTDRPKWFVLFEKPFHWVSFLPSWLIYTAT